LDTGLLSLPHPPRRPPAFPLTAPPSSLPAPAVLPSPPAPLATCRPSPPVQSWPPAHQHSPAALWLSAGVVLPSVLTARCPGFLKPSSPAPPAPLLDTLPRSCVHSILRLRTTRLPLSAAASSLPRPAPPTPATPGSPQTVCSRNRCADSACPSAAKARSAGA